MEDHRKGDSKTMTYTSNLGVCEQSERYIVDMYAHAKTEAGAWRAAIRTLEKIGFPAPWVEDCLNMVNCYGSADFGLDDCNRGIKPQGNFAQIEEVDEGRYYVWVGMRKDKLNQETISRLSHKAAKSRTDEDDTIEMSDYMTPAADLSEGIEKASRTHGPAVLIYSTCHDFRVCVYVSGVLISTHVCAAVVVSPESVKSNPSLDGAIYTGQIVKMAVGTPTNPVYIGECVGAVIDVRPDIDDSKKSEGVRE